MLYLSYCNSSPAHTAYYCSFIGEQAWSQVVPGWAFFSGNTSDKVYRKLLTLSSAFNLKILNQHSLPFH